MKKKSCLVPGCDKRVRTRGLCNTHYVYAHSLVSAGKTNWDELERNGRVLAAHANNSEVKTWLLEKR